MPYNIRIVSTYPPRRCGIGTFSRDLATALSHFTAEVGYIRVAAIDRGHGPYDIPVDLIIDQYNPDSWRDAITHICSRASQSTSPTAVALQHEFGLDPDPQGNDGRGANFVNMAKTLRAKGLTAVVYLHTVLDEPDDHQKATIRDLAAHSDGLVVTTESAIQILESDIYGIPHAKLKHIDHGIRMHNLSQFDRLALKREYGLENRFLITTLGLLSPGKGVPYAIRALGRFLRESCTEEQRKHIVYVVCGQCHPEFVKAEGGKYHREFQAQMEEALKDANVRSCRVKELGTTDVADYDIVFLDSFLTESTLLKLYGATNVMLLPYLNMQQISSGILADTLGSGRIAVTTKFRYARELIHSNKRCPEGLLIGRYTRGILVDPGEPSIEQVAQALDYLVFNESKRLRMERQAHQRGYQMRWNNSAWALLQYLDFVRQEKEIVTGRGAKFSREKPSKLDVHKYRKLQVTSTVEAVTQELEADAPS
ncbi:MAG: glycosyltransferase family protein [Planctomycetota bacterium]|jgi:glycosyltransferase involved in cell wall biosynthesis